MPLCDFGRLAKSELDALYAATDVGMIWDVGKRTTEKLNAGGIRTMLDLMRADITTLRRQFSVVLEKIIRELHGTRCMELDDAPPTRQQILFLGRSAPPLRPSTEFSKPSASLLRAPRSA